MLESAASRGPNGPSSGGAPARCSSATPEAPYRSTRPTAQRDALSGLGEALAACRAGDTLVVTKLDASPGP